MIKFFRKIRQKLLSENKFSKYLIYAIGEIVLVVIGILIALQINNWNEESKTRDSEQALLHQLSQEFESNLAQLNQKIRMRELMISSAKKLLNMIDDPQTVIPDSIGYLLSYTRMNPTFDPIRNDLTGGNKLALIRDNKLKVLLTNWESNAIQLDESEVQWLNCLDNYYRPLIYEYNLAREMFELNYKSGSMDLMTIQNKIEAETISNGYRSDDFLKLLKDPRLESHLAWTIGINTFGNQESITLKEHIEDILQNIKKQLRQ